jgi:flagellar motor protein MotB
MGEAVNTAVVHSAGAVSSNIARAAVQVSEDLLRSHCFIVGRVTQNPESDATDDTTGGVPDVRIYLEDGTYTVTDTQGRYHFEGVKPGVHVVQLDLESLPDHFDILSVENNTRAAGRGFSQFVDLAPGTLWRTDFYVGSQPRAKGRAQIQFSTKLDNDTFVHTAHLTGASVPLRNRRLTVMLPTQTTYLLGTSQLNGTALPDPRITGNVLTYDLGDASGAWQAILTFKAKAKGSPGMDLLTRAVLIFDTPSQKRQQTPVVESSVRHTVKEQRLVQEPIKIQLQPEALVVEGTDNLLIEVTEESMIQHPTIVLNPRFGVLIAKLSDSDKAMIDRLAGKLRNLEIEQIVVTGHSDATPIKPNNQHLYADNHALSLARAQSVARQLVRSLSVSPAKIQVLGKGADEPIASNATASGRARNRRVCVQIKSKELHRKSAMRQIPSTVKRYKTPDDLSDTEKQLLDGLALKLKKEKVVHINVAYLLKSESMKDSAASQKQDVSSLSMARAQAIGTYLVRSMGLTDTQFSLIGKSPAERRNQAQSPNDLVWDYRIDIRVHTEKIKRDEYLTLLKPQDRASVVTTGLYPGQVWEQAPADGKAPEAATPTYDAAWLETAQPGLQWLTPAPGIIPAIPTVKIAVKHPADTEPVLMLNGELVSPLNFSGTDMDSTKTKAVSHWTGVDLVQGDNHFDLLLKDGKKGGSQLIAHRIHYPGPPVKAELVAETSRLIADGKQPALVAVRLKDPSGHPVRPGVTGQFTVQPPYAALQTENQRSVQPLTLAGPPKAQYVVEKEGIALIALQPTTQSGEVVLNLHLVGGEHEIRCWLQPEPRDWILVGLAQGTAGYSTLSGNMENLQAADQEQDLYQEGRIALFAKGKIKGSWLLTLAYDSDKDRDDQENRLFQTIDPDTYYTLYGDDTEQGYDAASIHNLYVKIERNQFYALFGDYETGLTVTELSRYNRRLNGLKTEWQHRHASLNAFASETDQAFVKDEIRGDGTTGLYHLSRNDIIVNSESIRLETRDRFHSETIISTQPLTRHIDYNIDYDTATIFFKFPVYSQDENLNPTYIVADYETDGASDNAYTYGGRAAARMLDRKIEIGASYIHEGPVNGEADLTGVDATIQLPAGLAFKAELAASQASTAGAETDGQAYLAELTQSTDNFNARAYVKEQEEAFGLGQQNGSETATRKYGLDMSYRFSDHWRVNGQASRQHDLATTAERDLDEAALVYARQSFSLRSGFRLNEDRLGDGTTQRSELLTAGGTLKGLNQRLQLRLDHEHAIDNESASTDFPSRTTLGADYQISDNVALYGAQEFLWHRQGAEQNTRLGAKTSPWQGGQISTDVQQSSFENGRRLSANLGLFQTWRITDRWRLDGGLDRSQTIDQSENQEALNPGITSSQAAEAFTSLSLGVGYDADSWSWTSRVEARNAESQEKRTFLGGIAGEPRKGLGLAAGITLAQTSSETAGDSVNGDIRLSMVLRPLGSAWTLLDRLDYRFDEQDSSKSESRRLINNLHLNYKPHHKLQIALQYGAKYVLETFDSQEYDGFVDLIGLETRYDLTSKWDVGFRGSTLHSWQTGQMEYSTGLSIGHTVFKNTWISAGYNFMGFEDDDFSRANYTAQGPFVQFRMKFDQQSVREMLDGWGLR